MQLSLKTIFLVLVACTSVFILALTYQSFKSPKEVAVPLADGEYVGFVTQVDVAEQRIVFDNITWHTGTSAVVAALDDGVCTEAAIADCAPGDYYIENDVVTLQTVQLGTATSVTLLTLDTDETKTVAPTNVSLLQFAEMYAAPDSRWKKIPYRLSVMNESVVWFEEVYIP